MSSEDIAIRVKSLSKCYEIYPTPKDRLKQFFIPRIQDALGMPRAQYFNEFWALQDVSFDIKKGETVGIIGRNGSGKSTLLQIICGTLNPTHGSVETNGRVAALLELGSGFNPEFTGRENVYLNGAVLGLTKEEIDKQFDEISKFAEIGDFMDQPIKTYSSGMVVRLAFAVQAHVRPDILIVDEALAVGDIFFQQKCTRFMRDKLSDCTKFLVTHDMQAIYNFCSRVIFLEAGRIIYIGDVKEGIEAYMRSNHNQMFDSPPPAPSSATESPSSPAIHEASHGMQNIEEDAMGGRRGVSFTGYSVTVNGQICQHKKSTVFHGDKIEISMSLTSAEALSELIIGYLIVDRNGMYVCGDNTLSLDSDFSISPNNSKTILISFTWPAIANGSYTLTLGIGRGKDPLSHVIECWAHSIFAFENINHSPVHGLFTNRIHSAQQVGGKDV